MAGFDYLKFKMTKPPYIDTEKAEIYAEGVKEKLRQVDYAISYASTEARSGICSLSLVS